MTNIRNTRRLAAALTFAIGALTFAQPAKADFWDNVKAEGKFLGKGLVKGLKYTPIGLAVRGADKILPCTPCKFDARGIPAPQGYRDHRNGRNVTAGRGYASGPGLTRPNATLPTPARPTFNPNVTGGGRPGQFDNGNRRPNLNTQISGGGRPGAFDNRGGRGGRASHGHHGGRRG